jgi:hypothetical protein
MGFDHDLRPDEWDAPAVTARIWRYMSLARFLHLVAPRADGLGRLFFARADLLGDDSEGGVPNRVLDQRAEAHEQLGEPAEGEFAQTYLQFMRAWPRHFGVSCWHDNRNESSGQWGVYANGEGSIALQSTAGDLPDAIAGKPIRRAHRCRPCGLY